VINTNEATKRLNLLREYIHFGYHSINEELIQINPDAFRVVLRKDEGREKNKILFKVRLENK